MRLEELDYHLPPERIATRPVEPRDAARLLVYRRQSDAVEHARVRDLPSLLGRDALVVNDTSVLPARLLAVRLDSGGRVEGLFLGEAAPGSWSLMLRSNGRLRQGLRLALIDPRRGEATTHQLTLSARDGAVWTAELSSDLPTEGVLDRVGMTPLPPYILRARASGGVDGSVPGSAIGDDRDRAWYQTVYAEMSKRRSVAAPTAGLHFTPDLLTALSRQGVTRLSVTLHVGAGTFQPVSTDRVEDHPMHREWFSVPRATLEGIARVRAAGGRAIAVGTTAVRALESAAGGDPCVELEPPSRDADVVAGATRLMIAPGYAFRLVDGLMTNFHLPRSTLLLLVGAMVGLDRLKSLYAEAIERGYRFYSYGDAMLVLP